MRETQLQLSPEKLLELNKEIARNYLIDFTVYTKPDYTVKWFHRILASKLDDLARNKIKRLMVFMPPQHGKSELVSRRFPAYLFGLDPTLNIAVASYAQSLAIQFNRETQRIIDGYRYQELFPWVHLAGARSTGRGEVKRAASEYEIDGYYGRMISVGVGSGLTGRTVDVGIIDDPIKDAEQAYSTTYRENVWDWYLNVFCTRLHNESRVLLTMTRWHEDDLAGRILKTLPETGEQWEILRLPAIKENDLNPLDPRQMNEALWPEKHSKEKIMSIKKSSSVVYNALYQQTPAAPEGNKIKIEWIRRFRLTELIAKCYDRSEDLVWDFTVDGAYTADPKNDATGLLAFSRAFGNVYIRCARNVRLEMPDLLKYIPDFCMTNGYTKRSRIWIEPKASGLSIAQMLKDRTNLNVIIDRPPTSSKESRVDRCIPYMEGGSVYVLEGEGWVEEYLNELRIFPNSNVDNLVDCTTMAIDKVEIRRDMEIFGHTVI
jgi:predicted phage terminase large subunit-like protein